LDRNEELQESELDVQQEEQDQPFVDAMDVRFLYSCNGIELFNLIQIDDVPTTVAAARESSDDMDLDKALTFTQ